MIEEKKTSRDKLTIDVHDSLRHTRSVGLGAKNRRRAENAAIEWRKR